VGALRRGAIVILSAASETDADAVRSFVARCGTLAVHTPFTYWVTLRYWGSLCVIATEDDEIAGYLSSIGSAESADLLYVWQIGVAPCYRGRGLAWQLLQELARRGTARGYRRCEVSIERDNEPSLRLFARLARAAGGAMEEVVGGDEPTYVLPLALIED
jgi:L-2,4-diaminobutyric acid acetyltransferase